VGLQSLIIVFHTCEVGVAIVSRPQLSASAFPVGIAIPWFLFELRAKADPQLLCFLWCRSPTS
jgi:hypothetical protein